MTENYTLKFPSNLKINRIQTNVAYRKEQITYLASYKLSNEEVIIKTVFESDHKSSGCNKHFKEV